MFDSLLIANRGEIAVRVMRTAKEMGIRTIAVYSDADSDTPHVLQADDAVCIGSAEPAQSYLNIEAILKAAKESGAKAIHPGYGFLSENPEFARAVDEAGLIFVGPAAEVMAALGDKTSARELARSQGVPVTPGFEKRDASAEELEAAAKEIGYPVLIKAAAGGGGKGMRVVSDPALLVESAKQAASEAKSAFGDGTIYLEKYLERPRHVEIQIMADKNGHAIHLFERECSIQRRHQKIVEESPSPVLDADLRERMGQAAVALVKAAGYVNAGTVEFLLDENNNFYFLEVNTRLQVEHPVTEMITGLDLVRLQLQIADGQALSLQQQDVTLRGHAIECRLYAEDAAKGFLPSPGKILLAIVPEGPGVRFDHAIRTGLDVPVYYDPMLGKLIATAPDRNSAIQRMIRALEECVILGVATPVEFLLDVLRSPAFRQGETHTHFIEQHFCEWTPSDDADVEAAVGYTLAPAVSRSSVQYNGAAQGIATPFERLGKWDLYDPSGKGERS